MLSRITEISVAEFWSHGYVTGYAHREAGLPPLVRPSERRLPNQRPADVIPISRPEPELRKESGT